MSPLEWVKSWEPVSHDRNKARAEAGLPLECIAFNVRLGAWCALLDAHKGACVPRPEEPSASTPPPRPCPTCGHPQ